MTRFPYGERIDWTIRTAERNWWFVPAVGLGAWRAWVDGRAWTIPFIAVAGYLLAVVLHHRARFGERGRLEEWTERADQRPILYLFVIPIGAVAVLVLAVAVVVAIYRAIAP